jgi:hypothetical protein
LATPLLSVITASAAEGDCIADAVSADYDITRRGNMTTVAENAQLPDAIGALLTALEDCPIKNELPPVKARSTDAGTPSIRVPRLRTTLASCRRA